MNLKSQFIIGICVALMCALCGLDGVRAETDVAEESRKNLMMAKLDTAQELLGALALEDFELIKQSAKQLNLLSMEAQWTDILSPTYGRLGSEFRSALDSMAQMADEENLEGATLSFMRVVMTCVECHKVVRDEENMAKNEVPLLDRLLQERATD